MVVDVVVTRARTSLTGIDWSSFTTSMLILYGICITREHLNLLIISVPSLPGAFPPMAIRMKVLHLMPIRLLDCGMKLYRRRKPVRQRPIVMHETVSSRAKSMMLRMAIIISNGYMREKDYPFSATDPMKVKIPSGSSRKAEFLTVEQMTELYEFYTDGIIPKTYKHPEQMKQSLGMFLAQYLCNGCNLYDLALLRYEDYYDFSEHKALRFYRHQER